MAAGASSYQVRKPPLSFAKSAVHLPTHEKRVRDRSHEPESHFVIDDIANESAADPFPSFRRKLMPMMPALERTRLLNIRKMMVPFEFSNPGHPPCA